MKKITIFMIFMIFFLTGCSNIEQNIFKLQNELTMNYGEKIELDFTNTTRYSNVEWTSKNESIAYVEDGFIYGMSPGVATIEVRVEHYYASCKVTVNSDFVISKTSKKLNLNEIGTLTIRTSLSNDITWTTSDNTIVSLESDGKSVVLRTHQVGIVTITATYGKLKQECIVTVVSI